MQELLPSINRPVQNFYNIDLLFYTDNDFFFL
jgi:hypothetical protein